MYGQDFKTQFVISCVLLSGLFESARLRIERLGFEFFFFILNVSLALRSSQLGEVQANDIRSDIHSK